MSFTSIFAISHTERGREDERGRETKGVGLVQQGCRGRQRRNSGRRKEGGDENKKQFVGVSVAAGY